MKTQFKRLREICLCFLFQDILPLFCGEKLSKLIKFWYTSLVVGVTWGINRRRKSRWRKASLTSLVEGKVSLLAWWLVHSADVTWSLSWGNHLPVGPAGPRHFVFLAPHNKQDACCFLFCFDLKLLPCQNRAGLVRGRRKTRVEKLFAT